MQVGTAKLFAFPAAIMPDGGTAPIGSLPGIAGILETFEGLLLLVGLFTRPVAFLLSGEMAVAYFYSRLWPWGDRTSRLSRVACFYPVA